MSHRLRSSVVSLGSASLGLLAASLTLHASGCGVNDDDLYTKQGVVCPPSADDGNPCTWDACSGGKLTHVPRSEGTQCALGENGGTCQSGLCVLTCQSTPSSCKCSDPLRDCPTRTACMDWLCEDTHCKASPRTETEEQTPGDCRKVVCTETGGSMSIPDDSDPPGEDGPCTLGTCMNGTVITVPRDEGLPCGDGQTGVCDSASTCVPCVEGTSKGCPSGQCYKTDDGNLLCAPITCFNQMTDGDETDTDCGGSCKPCALGSTCAGDSDCSNQICAPSLGSGEKVCCDALCTGTCMSCTKGNGQCKTAPTGTMDSACSQQGKVCAQGVGCASIAGKPCLSAGECISGLCVSGTCAPGAKNAPCFSAADCTSGACNLQKLTCQ